MSAGEFSSSHTCRAAFTRTDGTFGTARRIAGSKCPSFGLDIALHSSGRAIALIDGFLTRDYIKASYREPGGRFSPARRVSRNQRAAASLALAADGTATAAWMRLRRGRPAGMETATGVLGAGFGSPSPLVSEPAIGGIGGNQRGDVLAIWQSLEDFTLNGSYKPAAGQFGAAEPISEPLGDQQLGTPSVALGPEGQAMVAWSEPYAGAQRGIVLSERRK